jgi:hypothetical protein
MSAGRGGVRFPERSYSFECTIDPADLEHVHWFIRDMYLEFYAVDRWEDDGGV